MYVCILLYILLYCPCDVISSIVYKFTKLTHRITNFVVVIIIIIIIIIT